MRKVKAIEAAVLSRPGRYKPVADNLQVKEVVVGEGERRKRYVLCLNPEEAERALALAAEQKAARDARYAARKAAKKLRRRGY